MSPGRRARVRVPSLARVGVLGTQGQREASEAGLPTGAAEEGHHIGLSLVGVVNVRVCSGTCRQAEVVVGGVVDGLTCFWPSLTRFATFARKGAHREMPSCFPFLLQHLLGKLGEELTPAASAGSHVPHPRRC